MYNPFLITNRPFFGQPNEALLILKDLQPNRRDKAAHLENHKKNWAVAMDPAAAMDPAVSLSMYSPLPMDVVR